MTIRLVHGQGALTTRELDESGHLDEQPASGQHNLTDAAPEASEQPDAADEVRIEVNTRPHWYQLRMVRIDSDELRMHLEVIAAADWRRFNGWRTVTVTARDALGRLIEVVQGAHIPPCPQCGFSR